jgi:hypothetical protein
LGGPQRFSQHENDHLNKRPNSSTWCLSKSFALHWCAYDSRGLSTAAWDMTREAIWSLMEFSMLACIVRDAATWLCRVQPGGS